VACELYRQSIHWALLAHRALARDENEPSEPVFELFDAVDSTLLARAAGGGERLLVLRSQLMERSFVDFAELSDKRQRELAESARDFSRGLLDALEPARKSAERVWFRRALLVVGGLLALLVAILVARAVGALLEARHDLAANARWSTSSRFWIGGCASPRQDCAESPHYFFHTVEENDPWIVFDLGRVRQTTSVVVKNRTDCCAERAVPLVIELSTDAQHWTVVASRTTTFDVWRASYAKTRARYVKLHLPRPDGILHLKSVRVLR